MRGPAILVRTMSVVRDFGVHGYRSQYSSRSDHHSKVLSWAILFDTLVTSSELRSHARTGKVIIGINHEMRDFVQQRRKKLDLVIATPQSAGAADVDRFADLATRWGIALDEDDRAALDALPEMLVGPVGQVSVAVEAKATMTAHIRALPRLYDELNSSQLTVHGAADHAIAVGAIVVNCADRFASMDLNPRGIVEGTPIAYALHRQPSDAARVTAKVRELPRRSGPGAMGFDALGVVALECANDGTPVTLRATAPAPVAGDDYHYDQMVGRIVSQYAYRFRNV